MNLDELPLVFLPRPERSGYLLDRVLLETSFKLPKDGEAWCHLSK